VDGRRTRTKKKVRTEERPNPTMIIPLEEETTILLPIKTKAL
jgi:hypothetical protein